MSVYALMGITDNLGPPHLYFHVSSMCEKVWVREGGVTTLFPLRRVCPVPSGTSETWAQEQEGASVCVCVCAWGGDITTLCAPTALLRTPNFCTAYIFFDSHSFFFVFLSLALSPFYKLQTVI